MPDGIPVFNVRLQGDTDAHLPKSSRRFTHISAAREQKQPSGEVFGTASRVWLLLVSGVSFNYGHRMRVGMKTACSLL